MYKILLPLLLFGVVIVQGAEVGVKVNDSVPEQDTTISIKKGVSGAKKKYVISEGYDDISGEKDVLKKNAEKNWKKACDDWKAELKENNKVNNIISMSCGVMSCSKEGVESSCQSKGSFRIRTLAEDSLN